MSEPTFVPSASSSQAGGFAPGLGGIVEGGAEYHVRWGVRRYDLTSIRGDLDHCSEEGRGFALWGMGLVGIGATLAISFLIAINTSPLPRLSLRESLGWGGVAFLVLGTAFMALDKRFTKRAEMDIGYLKEKVDNLISMFDKENPGEK